MARGSGGAGTFVDHPGGKTTTTRKRRAGSSTSSQMRATIRTSAKRRDRKSRPLTMDGIPTAGRGTIFIGWDCVKREAGEPGVDVHEIVPGSLSIAGANVLFGHICPRPC